MKSKVSLFCNYLVISCHGTMSPPTSSSDDNDDEAHDLEVSRLEVNSNASSIFAASNRLRSASRSSRSCSSGKDGLSRKALSSSKDRGTARPESRISTSGVVPVGHEESVTPSSMFFISRQEPISRFQVPNSVSTHVAVPYDPVDETVYSSDEESKFVKMPLDQSCSAGYFEEADVRDVADSIKNKSTSSSSYINVRKNSNVAAKRKQFKNADSSQVLISMGDTDEEIVDHLKDGEVFI